MGVSEAEVSAVFSWSRPAAGYGELAIGPVAGSWRKTVFTRSSLLALLEADLPEEFKAVTEQHLEFFRSNERVNKLKELRKPEDTEADVRLKMLAVICRVEPSVESILLALLNELAKEKNERWTQIDKFSLSEFWWKQVAAHFGYVTPTPALLDFVLCLFRAVTPLGNSSSLDPRQSQVFLNRWMDSGEHREAFEMLSERADGMLNISAALNQIEDVRPLLPVQTYRRIDLKILADLRDGPRDWSTRAD